MSGPEVANIEARLERASHGSVTEYWLLVRLLDRAKGWR